MRLPTDEELKQDPKLMRLLRLTNENKFGGDDPLRAEKTPSGEELGA